MKAMHKILLAVTSLSLGLSVYAGDPKKVVIENPCSFDNVRRPITNPTLFDTALPQTKIHAIVLHQNLAENVLTTVGRLPMGGETSHGWGDAGLRGASRVCLE